MKLEFSTYLCGRSKEEYNKEKLTSHIKNIDKLKIDSKTKQDTIGFETYCSEYEDITGKSQIIFTIDKVNSKKVDSKR